MGEKKKKKGRCAGAPKLILNIRVSGPRETMTLRFHFLCFPKWLCLEVKWAPWESCSEGKETCPLLLWCAMLGHLWQWDPSRGEPHAGSMVSDCTKPAPPLGGGTHKAVICGLLQKPDPDPSSLAPGTGASTMNTGSAGGVEALEDELWPHLGWENVTAPSPANRYPQWGIGGMESRDRLSVPSCFLCKWYLSWRQISQGPSLGQIPLW